MNLPIRSQLYASICGGKFMGGGSEPIGLDQLFIHFVVTTSFCRVHGGSYTDTTSKPQESEPCSGILTTCWQRLSERTRSTRRDGTVGATLHRSRCSRSGWRSASRRSR